MAYNFDTNQTKIRSAKTHKTYNFEYAGNIKLNEDSMNQIVNVCNEPIIYNNVFSSIFKGNPYTPDNAKVFINLISEGAKSRTRFDWLILFDGEIVGTVGIKSLDGEIGYWQSSKHPGVMTLAVQKLCSLSKQAGFSSLWAHVKRENTSSIRVLEKAGFQLVSNSTGTNEDLYKYQINL